ncbi:MAG: GTPase HflX [Bacteroidota bacterium]
MKKLISTTPPPPTTLLVGLTLPGTTKEETQAHLDELAALATTRGIKPIGQFVQKVDKPNSKTWIGKGKIQEIITFTQFNKVDSILFDDELSPGKIKNLAKLLPCKIWDRTLLILEIFAMRAQTAQAKTQVQLAQYQYLLPRLTRMWTHLSRQKGGAGMQGTGEKELETDKRIVQKKIHLLKEKLEAIEKQAITKSKQRNNQINVALVGYTNAGKSTLMQLLSKHETLIEDKLFATVSTTVRKVVINDLPFLLSDTVGFIRKLPHHLIECFKSTLHEVAQADFLLHVVDFSHPKFQAHIHTVNQTLHTLGAEAIPTMLILNKADQMPAAAPSTHLAKAPHYDSLQKKYRHLYHCPVALISAQKKENLPYMYKLLHQHISKKQQKLYPQNTQRT